MIKTIQLTEGWLIMELFDMIVIGGGPAGYTAAMYAARAGLSVVVVERMSAGGQMALTLQIDNYPGFDEGIGGHELGQRMRRSAERFGARTRIAEVTVAELSGPVKIVRATDGELHGRTIVAATGATHRRLGLPNEQALTGRGVGYCAACDGMFYRGKTVAVVGGGNSAVADALLLSRICNRVIVIHRRDRLRATKVYHAPLMEAGNVEFRYHSVVEGFVGSDRLSALALRNVETGEPSTLDVDGAFISIGRAPETTLFRNQLPLDDAGYIVADETTRTPIPGVFAAGDVRTKPERQIVTAVADGAVAAFVAEEYLVQGDGIDRGARQC